MDFNFYLFFILDNEILAEFGFGWYDSSETMLNKNFSLNLSSFGLWLNQNNDINMESYEKWILMIQNSK